MSEIGDLLAKLAAERAAERIQRLRSSTLVQQQVARAMKDIAPEATLEQVISVSLVCCNFFGGDSRGFAHRAEAWVRSACCWKHGAVEVRCAELMALIEADGLTPTIHFFELPSGDHHRSTET